MVELIGCSLDEICSNSIAEDYARGSFSNDWFDGNIAVWDNYKPLLQDRPNMHCLEIGSYEGRSALYAINNYCNGVNSMLDALDTWEGSIEHTNAEKEGLFERFTSNVKKYIDIGRINLYQNFSTNTLVKICAEVQSNQRDKYDFIYIDGSHIAKDVLTDTVLAWEILKIGGLMIFDDYAWKGPENKFSEVEMNPQAAIDSFLTIYKGRYILLYKEMQVHILKAKN